jgi:peptide-methionine (R)-S-oxide reductase
MVGRRQFLVVLGSTVVLGPPLVWLAGRSGVAAEREAHVFPIQRSDDDWRRALTPQQYAVLRGHATERPFTSHLNGEKRQGTYGCAGCGQPLFDAATKFESGTGWPSFWQPLSGAIGTSVDRLLFMVRTEVHCAQCGGHLGHVFDDGPPPTGLRYCINGAALVFTSAAAPGAGARVAPPPVSPRYPPADEASGVRS